MTLFEVHYGRVVLAGLVTTAAYFLLGFVLFALTPLANEYRQFPAIYRTQESMKRVAPAGLVGMLLSMIALAWLYALMIHFRSPVIEGLRFGAIVAVFALGSFVIHNYVNLNISLRLTIGQAVAYFVQWIVAGVVIALIYR